MTKQKFTFLLIFAAIVAQPGMVKASPPLRPGIDYPAEIEDPQCLGINKEPYHATLMPYANLQEALAANRRVSSFARNLNGMWKFNWVPSPEQRPVDFYKTDYNVSSWKGIPVPSNWEVQGYGTPFYRNLGYTIKKDFPRVMSEPDPKYTAFKERNPVGSYRRDFELPSDWAGRRVFITFDGVDCAFFIWVNGEKVGYSTNSRNAAEFDLTKYVKPGKNVLAVEVYQYSSGTWLEDQDMWRLHGIFRNVTLWSAPQTHIRDFFVKTDLDNQYRDAKVEVQAKVKNYGDKPGKTQLFTATLYDRNGKEIAKSTAQGKALSSKEEQQLTIQFPVSNPEKWTAETPNLYTLVLSGSEGEIMSSKVGFRKIEIKGRIFMVNGVPIKLKGVNRHEHWSDVGHAITEEQMIRDLQVIKQGNCNHVRTCHYSDDPRWYELCDEWGIWLVAEANCECHGYDRRFDEEPLMKEDIISRNVANVENFKNHPSVIIWSLGNECGGVGTNFVEAMNTIKKIDPTRFVYNERFGIGEKNPSDFDGKMYGTPEMFASIAQDKGLTKPFYICEYAHAMFNSMGSLAEYSEMFDNNPSILGGAIWEYQDQALWNKRDPNHPILAYGGGFGEFPNDHYFIHKGVVSYDRTTSGPKVKPHYPEMKKAYQWIKTELIDPAKGTIRIKNKYQFISLDGFAGEWNLTENGVKIAEGKFDVPHIEAINESIMNLPVKVGNPKAGADYFLNVSYTQKGNTLWANRGFEVAAEQFKLPINTPALNDSKPVAPVKIKKDGNSVKISGNGFSLVFDQKTGFMTQLNKGEKNLLVDGESPKLVLWRAAHRNDDMWAYDNWSKYGLNSLTYTPVDFKVTKVDKSSVKIVSKIKSEGKEGFEAYHTATYLIKGDGSVKVENDVTFAGPRINLGRIGIQYHLDKQLDRVTYFGRGPQENYSDRKTGAFVGLYDLEVNNQYEYEKPMEYGNHEDVRWAKLSGNNIPSIQFNADGHLMQISAIPYTDEEMFPVEYKIDLPKSNSTIFTLSAKTLGVGSAGCGYKPLQEYLIWTDETHFIYSIEL